MFVKKRIKKKADGICVSFLKETKSRISDVLGPHNDFFRKKNQERSNYCSPRLKTKKDKDKD